MILDPHGRPARAPRAQSLGSAFESAKSSNRLTMFFFPSLDPNDQFTERTREDLSKNIHWLYNNVGAVRLVVNGLARDEVDTGIWPRAETKNEKFNDRATDLFDEEGGDARFWDEAGVENCYTQQLAIRRNIYGPGGELFAQMLRPGEGTNQATFVNIPSWMVGNRRVIGRSSFDQSQWIDGTRANEFGRVIQYRVYTNKERTATRDVEAGDMLHFHDPFWPGQRRGMSPLASVARKLYSIDQLERATNSGELLRQRIAYKITKAIGDDDEPSIVPGATVVQEIEVEDGEGKVQKLHVQRIVTNDGNDVDIADLPPGRDMGVVESNKATDAQAWIHHMLTDVAYATEYPPAHVFFKGGLGQGTEVRSIGKQVQRVKNYIRQNQLIPQYWKRVYPYKLWQWIKAGRFADVEGGIPRDWWRVRFICPPDDTVDVAREGRLYDDRVNEGNMSPDRYHEINGEYGIDVERQIVRARIRRLKLIAAAKADPENAEIAEMLSYDEIFRQPSGQRVAVPAPQLEDVPPTPPVKPERNGNSRSGMNGHFSRA